jgi:fibronectin type 3 domain-containing protein
MLWAVHGFAQAPPAVPATYQDLYNSLQGDLDTFNATLNAKWNGSKYPVLFSGNLMNADANSGPPLIGAGSLTAVQLQLQGLKALGVKAVLVEVPFPMLYQPFFSSQSQYQQFVDFYSQVASSVHGAGLKLAVESETMLVDMAQAGWDTKAFYSSLNWTEYQQARAQTALAIAQTMRPDYMVVLEEPDTEARMSGQSEINTVSGATAMLSLILASVRQSGVPGLQVGAGVGTWHPQYLQFTQSFVTLPLDFIDIHIYPVNLNFLSNALTIASTAAAAGKPIAMAEAWMWKLRDSELKVLTSDQTMARNAFSFWMPLDAYFNQTMMKLANYTKMVFMVPFNSSYFFAYLPYDSATDALPAAEILAQETQQSQLNIQQAMFTSVGVNFHDAIVSPKDTASPSIPANPTGVSGAPTGAFVSWGGSTDNVGVAGYRVFRDGVRVATTAQAYYQDAGLIGSTLYSYAVVAFDVAGNVSLPSLSVSVTTKDVVPPTAPANLVAAIPSSLQINLSWSPSTDNLGLGSYRIFRGTAPAALTQVGATYSTSTSFINYPLTPGTTYYFGVESVDASGNVSPMSPVMPARTPALPSAPHNVVANPVSPKQISLTWVAGASVLPIGSYRIYRGTSPGGLSQLAIRGTPLFNDYPVTPGTVYYYAVQEVTTGGDLSAMSATVKVTTPSLNGSPTGQHTAGYRKGPGAAPSFLRNVDVQATQAK